MERIPLPDCHFLFRLLIFFACFLIIPFSCLADEEEQVEPANPESSFLTLKKEIAEGFDWRFKILGFGIVREPVDSPLNPGNVLEINRYQAEMDLRPDLSLKFRKLDLGVKPRGNFAWKEWEDGVKDNESEGSYDLFVNEWWARYMVVEEVMVSYGRENLQWGPSLLVSPSNPFNPDNGKNNPYIELPGLDYARTVWIPSQKWSTSFIANVGEGEADFVRHFYRKYALKLDFTGHKKYFSLIPAYSEADTYQVGYFGGISVSDALLLYSEGNVRKEDDFSGLVGGSYTLEMGPTFSIEYYYNGAGCTGMIRDCFPPYGDATFDDQLIRNHYILAQVYDSRLRNVFNVVARWIGDLDDGSTRSVGIVEYEMGEHTKIFTVGDYFTGGENSEMNSLLQYSVFFGMEYNF